MYHCSLFNPLSPNIKEQILLSCPHSFLIKVLWRSTINKLLCVKFFFLFFSLYCQGIFAIVELADEESVSKILCEESLPPLNSRQLTVKERTVNKVRLQNKTPKSKNNQPGNDSQQHPHGQWQHRQIAEFVPEELINELKSSVYTVGGKMFYCYI